MFNQNGQHYLMKYSRQMEQ